MATVGVAASALSAVLRWPAWLGDWLSGADWLGERGEKISHSHSQLKPASLLALMKR